MASQMFGRKVMVGLLFADFISTVADVAAK